MIYARYSSDNQREESIEGQIRECTAYAEKNGITIVKHYIDRAISAKTDNRPEFQQMIKDSDKKLFDIVLVWKLDRFARNRYDSARYKTQLKKNGVKLMPATEIISEGPEGIILESVLEGYAEYYSADLAEKVVRGQTENILKGRCNGGRGTFGYTLDSERKFHIDPLASLFVLESFRKYRDGLTMKEIRDWLNENGIKNPVGGAFTYNSVEHMLKNRRYIGELKFRDVVVPDAIPPIIPLELFEDVQEKIAKNKKAPARRKAEDDYLLTTKLYCGYCGALMFGESGTSRTGEVHRYYKCATAKKKKGCKNKTVRKQWLEDLVVNQTTDYSVKTWKLVGIMFVMLVVSFGVGFLLKPLMNGEYRKYLPFMVSVYEGGLMAYPLYTSLCGQENLSQIAVLDIAGLLFGFSIYMGMLGQVENGEKINAKKLCMSAFHTPAFIASVLGILAGLSKVVICLIDSPFGGAYLAVEGILTTSVTAIILIVVGYSMELTKELIRPCLKTILMRVLLQTLMAIGVLWVVHLWIGDNMLLNLAIISYMSAPATFSMQTFLKKEEGSAYVSTTNSIYCMVSILVYIILAAVVY